MRGLVSMLLWNREGMCTSFCLGIIGDGTAAATGTGRILGWR